MSGKVTVKAPPPFVLLCALLVALAMPGSTALANDSGVSVGAMGGSVHPIWSTDVRLVAETVQAVCFGSFAEYRVDFRFVNEGKERKVRLGFPFLDEYWEVYGVERPVGFQAWQNGRPLAVRALMARRKHDGMAAGYFVHEAVFPHGTSMITVSYLAAASHTYDYGGSEPGGERFCYQYWLHTGSTWKGKIGKAVVRYRFADSFDGRDVELSAKDAPKSFPVTAPPHWTKPLPRTYQWQFSDFEPAPARASDWWEQQSLFDVALGYARPSSLPPARNAWTVSSCAEGFGGDDDYRRLEDGDLGSCWAEGVPGPGIGEWVERRFKRPTLLRELRVLPGNNAYDSAFGKFARPKTLTAVFSDGSSRVLHFRDSPTLQRFPVDVTTRSVRFVFESVYEGTDYPAACISEVEFGEERAPGYAPFRRLISDSHAAGRVVAWAGPPAPAPRHMSVDEDSQEAWDAEKYAGGDLLGVTGLSSLIGEYVGFPADVAPFKEPATLAAVTARDPLVILPDRELVGDPVAVNALSYWTYEIRYASGIDLLVNTRLSGMPRVSLLSELAREIRGIECMGYVDHRKLPFDLVSVGRQVVGVARAGAIMDCSDCSETGMIPGQVFWRDGNRSFHLYARSEAVTIDQLTAVARSLIDRLPESDREPTPAPTPPTSSASTVWPWWLELGVAVIIVAALVALLGLWQRRAAARSSETPS